MQRLNFWKKKQCIIDLFRVNEKFIQYLYKFYSTKGAIILHWKYAVSIYNFSYNWMLIYELLYYTNMLRTSRLYEK